MTDTKIWGQVSLEFWKKKTFACAIFGKICYVVCVINRASKSICLRTCLRECNSVGLIDKPNMLIQKYYFC